MKRLTQYKNNATYFAFRDKMPVDYSAQLNACIGGEVLNKLGQLEDIEEELGIDLITLIKALKGGIWLKTKNFGIIFVPFPRLVHFKEGWRLRLYNNEGSLLKLTTYGKTWALTREELENE